MKNIRPALPVDASRIAEIIIFNYRTNFYHFFQNDVYYYKELNVLDMASEYSENAESLKKKLKDYLLNLIFKTKVLALNF